MTHDPTMRVLTVLELLQSREEMSGAELAKVLEVSSRTVQRYVARLQDLGIPVQGRRGPGGNYRLKPGFRLPPLMLSGEEAQALTLGLRTLRLLGLEGLTPAAALAAAKLARCLPQSTAAQTEALSQRVGLSGFGAVPTPTHHHWQVLLGALADARAVAVAYRSAAGEVSRRTLHPYGVAFHLSRWYVVGHCTLRGALRSLRVDRLEGIRRLDEGFCVPQGFDALAHLQATLPQVPARFAVRVWVGCAPGALHGTELGWRTELSEQGGGTLVVCRRDELGPLAAALLLLDCPATVLEPPELLRELEQLRERATALLARVPAHAGSPDGAPSSPARRPTSGPHLHPAR